MLDRLQQLNVEVFFADNWEAYTELIPSELLVQTKAETHGVERNNFCQCHWFACFRRKTCVVSRSQQMVDLTMSLYAKFWVNSTFNAITLFS
jgi:insertion element IS1 protein InsB